MRIELNEVNEARSKLAASVKATKSDLSRARTNGNQIQSTDSLKGKVKDAINNEMGNYTIPLMNGYETAATKLQTEFQHLINEFMNIVQETDSNAIIDTDALESMSRDLNHERDNVDDEIKDANKAISSVSDIIDLGKLSNSKVDSKVKSATRKIKKISDDMEAFNNVKVKGDIDAVMNSVNSTLKVISPTASAAGAYKSIANKKIFESKKYRKMISKGIKDSNKITTAYEEKDNKELDKTFASLDNEQLAWFGKKLESLGLGIQGLYDGIDKNPVIATLKNIGSIGTDTVENLTKMDKMLNQFYNGEKDFKGIKAAEGMDKIWNWAIERKWLSSKIKAGKFSPSLSKNIEKISNWKYLNNIFNTKVVQSVSKTWKTVGETVHPLKSLKKVSKRILEKDGSKVWNFIGKKGAKFSKKAGIAATLVVGSVGAAVAYNDKSNKKTYHNIGHSIVHTTVDSVKNAGPIDFAISFGLMGSEIAPGYGTVAGVGFGLGLGLVNWGMGKLTPKTKDNLYNNLENTADNGIDIVGNTFN